MNVLFNGSKTFLSSPITEGSNSEGTLLSRLTVWSCEDVRIGNPWDLSTYSGKQQIVNRSLGFFQLENKI